MNVRGQNTARRTYRRLSRFLYQLDERNEDMEILRDLSTRKTVTLKELLPGWWGRKRYAEWRENN